MLHNVSEFGTMHETLLRSADILDQLSTDIETLGALLCEDPEIFMRHCTAVQKIDLIAQQQRGLASVIRASDRNAAIDEISVEELRHALRG